MSTLADRIRGVLQGTPGPRRPGIAPPVRPDDALAADPQTEAIHQPVISRQPLPSGSIARTAETSLESVLGGGWRQFEGARCFMVESRRAPSSPYGHTTVGTVAKRLREAAGDVPLLAGCPIREPLCFFDLETTGLSGGAGTYAFLVGCASFDEDGAFVTRQFMLVRLADERALLTSVADELSRAGALVSFNGKSFDRPLIETRYLYHRLAWNAKAAGTCCTWRGGSGSAGRHPPRPAGAGSQLFPGALERQLLGHRRRGDVPGFEIPQRYFQFIRSGDARPLAPVFEHNRLDLLSLAGLTARVSQLARQGPACASDPREALALGWLYARAGLDARARGAYERAVDLSVGIPAIHVESLRVLAVALRHARQYAEAARYWQRILDVRSCPDHIAREASDALAIHHEHRVRDLTSARTFALRSLEHESRPAGNEAIRHRLDRIDRKLGRLTTDVPALLFADPSEV